MKIAGLIGSLVLAAGISSCTSGLYDLSGERAKRISAQYPEVFAMASTERELKAISGYDLYFNPDVQKRYTSLVKDADSRNRILIDAFNKYKHEREQNEFAGNLMLGGIATAFVAPFIGARAFDRRRKQTQVNK